MKSKLMQSLLLTLCLCFAIAGCAKEEKPVPSGTEPTQTASDSVKKPGHVTILFTNDVHGAFAAQNTVGEMGYAAVAAYRDTLASQGETVVLIDGGDALEPSARDTAVNIMNAVGYEFAVAGECELREGVSALVHETEQDMRFPYLCCNLINRKTGQTVFEPYRIAEYDGTKIAYVGITAPRALPQFVRKRYTACDGEDGQALYDCVQKAVDKARSEGAKYVVGIGYLGTDPTDSPFTSVALIKNTTGIDVFLDAGSHSVFEGETVQDKDDEPVLLCSTGACLTSLGQITIDTASDTIQVALVDGLSEQRADILKLLPKE